MSSNRANRALSNERPASWNEYCQDIEPCIFPSLSTYGATFIGEETVSLESFISPDLSSFSQKHDVHRYHIFQAAWALVLRCYVGSNSPCFALLESDTDGLYRKESSIPPRKCASVYCADVKSTKRVNELLFQLKKSSESNESQTSVSLKGIDDVATLSGVSLFNTLLSVEASGDLNATDGADRFRKRSTNVRLQTLECWVYCQMVTYNNGI